jgi:hypothetical protein
MATVYSPPENFRDLPDFEGFKDGNGRYDFEAHSRAEGEWIEELANLARKHKGTGKNADLIGETIHFQRGDGYAMYLVWKTSPLQLVHLPVGDAWAIPEAHSRGLRVSDVRQQVEGEQRMRELFGRKA